MDFTGPHNINDIENTNILVASKNDNNSGGISHKRFYGNGNKVLKDNKRANLQLNKATRLVTVPDKNYSVAAALTYFKKSTDNSVSVAYHKVMLKIIRESSYDIVNKEYYEKDCSKETSSNKKILSLRRKLLFDITTTQSSQIIGRPIMR